MILRVYLSLFEVIVDHGDVFHVNVCVCLQERRALERKISEMEEELKVVLFVCFSKCVFVHHLCKNQ